MDYSSTPINATFAVRTSTVTVNVPVIKDNIVEPSEAFNLGFSIPLSLSSRVIPGSPNTATGIINDSTSKISNYKLYKSCMDK